MIKKKKKNQSVTWGSRMEKLAYGLRADLETFQCIRGRVGGGHTHIIKRLGLYLRTFFKAGEELHRVVMSVCPVHGAETFQNYRQAQETIPMETPTAMFFYSKESSSRDTKRK